MLAFDGAAEFLVWLPVAACVVRFIPTRWCWLTALGSPVGVLALLLIAFTAAGLAWSADPRLGFEEWGKFRHALLVAALWPLVNHRHRLVAALAVGFAIGHLSQVAHALGVWLDVAWLRSPRLPDRNSGWWDPVVGGSLITAAVGLHLPAMLWGGGRWRWVGAVGVGAALAGVVATGTRGAWIGAGLLIAVGVGMAGVRLVRDRLGHIGQARQAGAALRGTGARAIWIALGVLVVGGGVGAVVAGPVVLERGERAVREVRAALEDERYDSDTGRRLLMWRESARAWLARPVVGVGPGGLRAWATPDVEARGVNPGLLLDHAHGMWVHVAATAGTVGLVLWGLLAAVALRGGMAARVGVARGGFGTGSAAEQACFASSYRLGPEWALLGLLLAGLFDSVHINSQTSMLLWVLVGLCAMRGGGTPGRGDSDRRNEKREGGA